MLNAKTKWLTVKNVFSYYGIMTGSKLKYNITGNLCTYADQRSRKRILICNLCVKRHMVPFSIAFKSGFYAIFMCLSVSKKVCFV